MIISVDAGNHFDKTQQSFMIKIVNKLRIEGNFLNPMNLPMKNLQLTSQEMVEIRQGYLLLTVSA